MLCFLHACLGSLRSSAVQLPSQMVRFDGEALASARAMEHASVDETVGVSVALTWACTCRAMAGAMLAHGCRRGKGPPSRSMSWGQLLGAMVACMALNYILQAYVQRCYARAAPQLCHVRLPADWMHGPALHVPAGPGAAPGAF